MSQTTPRPTQETPVLPPKRAEDSETAWEDPWQATSQDRATIYTKAMFEDPLREVGKRITEEINRDSEEVARLRDGIKEANEGKTRPLRRSRGTKSD